MRALVIPLVMILFQNPQAPTHQQAVVERGEHVMGFSHDKTTHHFLLFADGGEINVAADNAGDKASIEQIRMHLGHVVGMFSAGNFNAPMLIHDTTPPGVPTMRRLKNAIKYDYSETPQGARIRLATANSQAVDAIHAFLLFQIIDHHTGDAPAITNEPGK